MPPEPCPPLRPWEWDIHLEYYVAVDKTEAAFADFERQTRSPESLTAHGRLVVVLGGEGCGKTSLINRCIASTQKNLKAVGVASIIVDLTVEAKNNQSIAERMRHVCDSLIDQLDVDQRLDKEILEELRRKESPEKAYSYLSMVLKRIAATDDADLAVIVLLPPSDDLAEEVVKYSDLVRPRLLFFAESSYLAANRGWQAKLTRSGPAPPIVLTVGILDPRDGYVFARERLSRHHGKIPMLREDAMNELQDKKPDLAIGQVQRLLFEVYEGVLQQEQPVEEVTMTHITDHILQAWH
ncbi:MAG TPA: AAA-like domain-containing protein [Pseudonocardiaceae bacterium]|jgi:hypothetical protein|nr:AAA-like domain-containing protein [Pseudonocardiaceae bacterium]